MNADNNLLIPGSITSVGSPLSSSGEDRGQRCGGREEIGGGAGRGEGNNITHVLAGVSD